ncbi:MAG: hypothetical protein A2754_04255 [Candidatus Magasanikbacteria bacterium RIFCSPHIGHO2_01_FULL_47_8]|uniref:Uncharacterized protein n=1 Tax=Candidatus Magasanikbacteria bacterium RIFCSPHIGHO2_01_FULL_47_8 TaxID=1798673 RepID=A0A1F6MD94_9BACT|nr:MAG: hypothetical protein A2754_04255 [Candidatus Magasanikbacteria bacterium RIFCSPHIGHO2_01_FULL_47_8]
MLQNALCFTKILVLRYTSVNNVLTKGAGNMKKIKKNSRKRISRKSLMASRYPMPVTRRAKSAGELLSGMEFSLAEWEHLLELASVALRDARRRIKSAKKTTVKKPTKRITVKRAKKRDS